MALFDTTYPPYAPFGSRNLALGSTGSDVAVLQALYSLMTGTLEPSGVLGSAIPITGHFDVSTQTAVQDLQRYFGLSVDGVVGPNTFFVLDQGVGVHTTYGGPAYGSRQLTEGMTGGDVTILQNRLNGFRYSSMVGGPADGVFGPQTARAVLAFKQDAAANGDTGFPANSVVGYGTYNASWLYTFAGGRAITTGRPGLDVAWLQVLLKNLGYYTGTVNAFYDVATRAAVIAFQTAVGITADGVVGPVTFYQLGQKNPVAAPSPLGVAWPPAAAPSVTVCSADLASTSSANLHPYGVATLVVNESEGFESVDVVGNMLPPPATYGTPYSAYVFTLVNPATGQVAATEVMTNLEPGQDPSDWAGAYSPGVYDIPEGPVTVYAASTSGVMGPAVLAGNLVHCH